MPIKGRIDMLTTGIRTPVGLKISGANLVQIEQIGGQVEAALRQMKGTRSIFAERTGGGYFLDIDWNRDELARYGLSIDQAQEAVQNAIGGENIAITVQGRERYSVNVRYQRDFRSNMEAIGRVLVPVAGGQKQISLSQLAEVSVASGPAMIRDEDGLLTGYVYVDIAGQDPGGYIEEADRLLRGKLELPAGYAVSWSGQYEAMQRVRERLTVVVPVTLLLIVLLLYLNTRSLVKTAIVLLAVPFSAVGAVWFLYLLGYNMSIGVWVGLIALLGVDAETGVFMLLYLDLAYEKARKEGRLSTLADLRAAIHGGGGQAYPAEIHDRGHHDARARSHHVVHGDRGRRDEAHRGADGRGDSDLLSDGTDGLPGDLRDLEMELRDEKGRIPAGERRPADEVGQVT